MTMAAASPARTADLTPAQHRAPRGDQGSFYAVRGLCDGETVFALEDAATIYGPGGYEVAYHDGAHLPPLEWHGFRSIGAYALAREVARALNMSQPAGGLDDLMDEDGLTAEVWDALTLGALGFQI